MLCFGSLCICFFSNVVITFQASGRFSIRSRRAAGTSMGLEWLLCATRATAEIVAVAMATLATLATLATRATRRDQSQGSRPRGCYNLKSYQNLAVKLCERNDQYQIYHHSLELGSHFAQVEANLLQPLVDMASSVARAGVKRRWRTAYLQGIFTFQLAKGFWDLFAWKSCEAAAKCVSSCLQYLCHRRYWRTCSKLHKITRKGVIPFHCCWFVLKGLSAHCESSDAHLQSYVIMGHGSYLAMNFF